MLLNQDQILRSFRLLRGVLRLVHCLGLYNTPYFSFWVCFQRYPTIYRSNPAESLPLQTCLEQREECLAVLEQERRVQQAGLSKQSCCVKELTLEKQQLTAELEVQHMQLVSLTGTLAVINSVKKETSLFQDPVFQR